MHTPLKLGCPAPCSTSAAIVSEMWRRTSGWWKLKLGGVSCQPPQFGLPVSWIATTEPWREPSDIDARVTRPSGTGIVLRFTVGMRKSPSRSNFAYQALRKSGAWRRGL